MGKLNELTAEIEDVLEVLTELGSTSETEVLSYDEADAIATAKSYAVLRTLNDRVKAGGHVSSQEKREGLMLLQYWIEKLYGATLPETEVIELVRESIDFFAEGTTDAATTYKCVSIMQGLVMRMGNRYVYRGYMGIKSEVDELVGLVTPEVANSGRSLERWLKDRAVELLESAEVEVEIDYDESVNITPETAALYTDRIIGGEEWRETSSCIVRASEKEGGGDNG